MVPRGKVLEAARRNLGLNLIPFAMSEPSNCRPYQLLTTTVTLGDGIFLGAGFKLKG